MLRLSGPTDLLVRVAARDADDLYRIAGQLLVTDSVERTTTSLVMRLRDVERIWSRHWSGAVRNVPERFQMVTA